MFLGHITMEAARRCELVADDTPALDADWGKFHNPWENAQPRQVKRWGEGHEADQIRWQDVGCMYVNWSFPHRCISCFYL